MKTVTDFPVLQTPVHNRGSAPIGFLDTLVYMIKRLPDEVFGDEYRSKTEPDVFEFLKAEMSQLIDPAFDPVLRRRAFVCEVLRVLGGFESSWNWTEGRDVTNPSSNTLVTEEAGIFQCSANSMNFDPSLKECLDRHFGGPGRASVRGHSTHARRFISYTKTSPSFAIEYCARLLRFTVRHHGPLLRREIVPWLRVDCIQAFYELLTQTNITTPMPTPAAPLIRIMIDPGHGGADSGAVGEFQGRPFTEKDIVLRVAVSLAKRLKNDGRFEVFMTRTDDTFIALLDLASKANVAGADLISIHANAGGGTGFECFTSPGRTQSDQWAERCLDAYGAMFPGFTGRYDTRDGDKDKEAKFTVLAKTLNRAILFELGFMDRPSDLEMMIDQTFVGRAAEALYIGTCRFHGIEPKPIPGSEPAKEEDTVIVPVEGNPPVESLAGAFLEGYEAAIQQLQIRGDSTAAVLKKIFAGQQPMTDLPDYYRAWVGAYDAKDFLSHPEVRKAAGLPV